ncbi:MAG: amidohydrolase family protein [Acidobacteriota bacterium]
MTPTHLFESSPLKLLIAAAALAGLGLCPASAQDPEDIPPEEMSQQLGATPEGEFDLAIINATIHSLVDPAYEGMTVLVKDGIIASTGSLLNAPPGTPTVDAEGKSLFPGFIQAFSTLGLIEIGSVRGTRDVNETGENNADLRAEVAFNADSLRLPPSVRGGVLGAHVHQRGGLFSGTTAVMRLDGWNWRDMAVQTDAGMVLNFPQVADGGDDDDDDGKDLKVLNEMVDDVRAYAKARAAASPGLALDPKMEALVPVFKNELKLFVVATGGRNQIAEALDWVEQQELEDVVLVTNYEARYVKDRLAEASIPVIITDVLALPARDWEPYDAAYAAPAALHEAGVTFAIAGEGGGFASSNTRNLPFHAAMAAAFGLPRNIALRSVTQTPAEILGVGDRLGKVESGQDATFFLTATDPLEIYTQIERVWIAGREVDLSQDHQYRLYQKYNNRPRIEVELDGGSDPDGQGGDGQDPSPTTR